MHKKLTIEEMQELAKSKKGKCLSREYVNAHIKLKWQCKNGHIWKAVPNNIKSGRWCPICPSKSKLTIEEMQKLAKNKGGKCLSKKYINSSTKLKWQCKKAHVWEAKPNSVKIGSWCPVCAGKKKLTIEEMRELAKSRGGRCLSKEYINSYTKLKWKCGEGHMWYTAPHNIKIGQWCPVCGGKKKLTIEEMQELAKSKGGKCLSKEYVNSNTKLKWKCDKGHIWYTTPRNIKIGHWCPKCARENLSYPPFYKRYTINDMIIMAQEKGGKCLSTKYINVETKLTWQCAKGHVWRTTPTCIRTGHWCPVCAHAKKLSIEEMQKLAKSRGGKCLSKEYIDNHTRLKWQCEKGHVWEAKPNDTKRGSWCPVCAHVKKLSIEEMQELAKNKGGKCLSKKYINSSTKLKWQCEKGHVWEAGPSVVKIGTWCPYCRKLTIEEMQELAKSRGGKCLSKEYINSYTKLKWKCNKGHIWEAMPGNIKRGGWCLYCTKLSIEEMQKLAKSRGGKCLSREYINVFTKLKWQCKNGHTWEAMPINIKQGTWCPMCFNQRRGKR